MTKTWEDHVTFVSRLFLVLSSLSHLGLFGIALVPAFGGVPNFYCMAWAMSIPGIIIPLILAVGKPRVKIIWRLVLYAIFWILYLTVAILMGIFCVPQSSCLTQSPFAQDSNSSPLAKTTAALVLFNFGLFALLIIILFCAALKQHTLGYPVWMEADLKIHPYRIRYRTPPSNGSDAQPSALVSQA